MSLVINFLGGPGAGKSTMAAALYVALKQRDISCELVTEYPKELVWEENLNSIRDQLFVFANQAHRQEMLRDKVEIIITDSPILLSLIYNADRTSEVFKQLVIERFRTFNNLNYFINRNHESFESIGRIHDPIQSKILDSLLLETLAQHHIEFKRIDQSEIEVVLSNITKLYGKQLNNR